VKGQAEHIAGLISLASLILIAYVAGNTALELQRFGRQLAGEVLATKELLEIARVNETHIEVRSRWDGDSWVRYLVLCDVHVCNLTSVDVYVPRRGSTVVTSSDGLGDAAQICVITANENMFCSDSDTASAQELNQEPTQLRRALHTVERVPPTYAARPSGVTIGDTNVTRLWVWRQDKYPLFSNGRLYIYAYPADGAFFVTELDDILCSENSGITMVFYRVRDPEKMFDHDDSTAAYAFAWGQTIFVIDLGQVYTSGVLIITLRGLYQIYEGYYADLYFGTTLYEPTASSRLFDVIKVSSWFYLYPDPIGSGYIASSYRVRGTANGTLAFLLDSVPGGVRYIWMNISGGLYIASLELYLPSSYKSYIIATDPLVPQGMYVYPRTITALAIPGTSLRVIEET